MPVVAVAALLFLLFLDIADDRFGGQQEPGDARRVLQGDSLDLGRHQHAHLDHVAVLAVQGVVAETHVAGLIHLLHHDRAIQAGIARDLADRSRQGPPDDVHPGGLVAVGLLPGILQRLAGPQRSHAAARHDAFLDRRPCRVQRVLDAGLLLLHLGLGGSAHVDAGDAAGQLRQTLFQLLAIVVAGRPLDLVLDLLDASLDRAGLAGPFDDRGGFLLNHHLLGPTQVLQLQVLQVDAEILEDRPAGRHDRNVIQHALATIAKARGLDRRHLQHAAQLVDDQRRQGLALDVLGDDQERLARAGDLLEDGNQVLDRGDLLLLDQDVRVLQLDLHRFHVVDEVRAEVALVELHAFDQLDHGIQALALFHRDHAVLADLLHRLGDLLADLRVVVGRTRRHLLDLGVGVNRLGELLELLDHDFDGLVDAAAQVHRVGPGGNVLEPFHVDRLGVEGRRGRAVAGLGAGPAGDFLDELGADVLHRVFQLDLLGDGHAVLGDGRAAEGFLDHHVSPRRPQSALDCPAELLHAAPDRLAGLAIERNMFGCHQSAPVLMKLKCRDLGSSVTDASSGIPVPLLQDSQDVRLIQDHVLIAAELDLGAAVAGEEHFIALLDLQRGPLAAVGQLAFADRLDLAAARLFLGAVRQDNAASRLRLRLEAANQYLLTQWTNVDFGHR